MAGCQGNSMFITCSSVCAAAEARQPGQPDGGVPAQAQAPPGVRVLRPHRPQRAGPPSQRVGPPPSPQHKLWVVKETLRKEKVFMLFSVAFLHKSKVKKNRIVLMNPSGRM